MIKLTQIMNNLQPYLNADYELTFNPKHHVIEISTPYWNYINDGIGFYLIETHHQLYLTDGGNQIAEWGMNGFDTHDIKTTNHYVHTLLNQKHTQLIQKLVNAFNAQLVDHDELWMKLNAIDSQIIASQIKQFANLCVTIDKQLQIEIKHAYHQ